MGFGGKGRRDLALVLAVSWIARLLFIVLVPAKAHSSDADAWVVVASDLRHHINPYEVTGFISWPPLWIVVIWLLDHVSRALDISFLLALRVYLIAVESLVIVLLYRFLAASAPPYARRVTLWGIALNPVAILLVCQHGNFDVMVGLFTLAAAVALAGYVRARDLVLWLTGALAIGLGVLTKTVPLALTPLLARGARVNGTVARLLGAVLAFGPAALATAIVYAYSPNAVLHKVILYRSSSGWYGFSGLTEAIGAHALTHVFAHVLFPFALLLWVVAGGVYLARRGLDGPRTILLAALVMLAIPTIGNGYGPQYGYWWLPLLAATYPLFDTDWRKLLTVFYVIAAVDYVVEYAFVPSLGWFLEAFLPTSHFVTSTGRDFEHPGFVTLVRVPLFAASLAVLGAGIARVRRPTAA